MAVYRQVQITFWQDKFVLKLTPEEKFFYLYLLTNSKTKQCGVYELPHKVATFETGYDIDTIKKLIERFEQLGKIKYDVSTDEIAIKNWRKYNETTSPKTLACIRKELLDVKSKELLFYMDYERDEEIRKPNKQYRVSDKTRDFILARDNYSCLKCGSKENLTIDHIYPRTLGGFSDIENLRTLCRSCNSKRPLIGEALKQEIIESGYDYYYLKDTYQRGIGGDSQKEKEETKNKNNNNKKNKEEILGLFDDYFTNNEPLKKVWSEWLDFRSEIRKGLTEISAKKQLEFLAKQPDPIKCINQSIQNQWQGLFEVKDGATKNNTSKGSIQSRLDYKFDPAKAKKRIEELEKLGFS